jgi:hypothetical protein
MPSRWIALALLVLLGSVLVFGSARAQSVYTPEGLAALMLTKGDVNIAVGPEQSVVDVADGSPQSDSLIRVVRVFKTDLGIIAVTLFAHADGSAPTADERNTILGGQYLQDLATGVFSGVNNFILAGSTSVGDADQIALFTGTLNGASWDSLGDSFIKGNVFGAVLYSTPGQADGTILGILLGLQVSKLP